MTGVKGSEDAKHPGTFATTRWSLIVASADAGSADEQSARALADVCRIYWRPVFAYLRRRGYAVADAQDLTQEFFLKFIDGALLRRADPERGRFRTLLLHALNKFLITAHEKRTALKRGGGVEFISWDEALENAPSRLAGRPDEMEEWSPERVFDVRWAATVVEQAEWRLREECEQAGRGAAFDILRGYLASERSDISLTSLAGKLGVAEPVVKRLIHKLRVRYRELLRHEVLQTLENPGEVDDELRYLCAVLAASESNEP